MNVRARLAVAALFANQMLLACSLFAQQPAPTPTISVQVSDMHCANCAKKISRKLYAIPGVAQVKTDVNKHLAVVVPDKKRLPHPLALWEAVESAGFEPVLLSGPFGEFDSKEELEKSFKRTARR